MKTVERCFNWRALMGRMLATNPWLFQAQPQVSLELIQSNALAHSTSRISLVKCSVIAHLMQAQVIFFTSIAEARLTPGHRRRLALFPRETGNLDTVFSGIF